MTNSVINIVKGSPLFYELYDEEIEKIVSKCHVLSLEKGEYVFHEGDEGDEIYIILNGSASVLKNGVELARIRKGNLFGELVLLNETTRTADIVADTYTDLLMIRYEDIFGLYRTEPKIFSLLILNLARLLTGRLKDSSQTIKELNSRIREMEKKKAA
jgi:CRP/FNR family transcriptional regulator, cyclic AMP receptor protein